MTFSCPEWRPGRRRLGAQARKDATVTPIETTVPAYYLDADEELELAVLAQRGCVAADVRSAARSRVVLGLQGWIWTHALRKARGNRAWAEDYFQAVFEKLIEKFHLFEPQRGHRFSTWATFWMRQVIDRYHRRHGRAVRLPTWYSVDNHQGRRARINHAPMIAAVEAGSSLDQPIRPGHRGTWAQTVEDQNAAQPGEIIDERDRRAFVREVLARLHPKYRRILELRMEGVTLEQIAQLDGCTRELIRQREERAHGKFLRQALIVSKGRVDEFEEEVRSGYRYVRGRALTAV